MLTAERFNKIIETIEMHVERRSKDYWAEPIVERECGQLAFESGECGYVDDKAKNIIFRYLTGYTLIQYIGRRVIMRAYKELISQAEYDIASILNITGFSSESALYKKFREVFDMTPKEAFDRKMPHPYEGPARWETISDPGREVFEEVVVKEIPVDKVILDRKPYKWIIAGIGIALLFTTILWTVISYYRKWGGEYYLVTDYQGSILIPEETFVIDPFTGMVNGDSFDSFFILKSIDSDGLHYQINGKEFTAVRMLDGRIDTGMNDLGADHIWLWKKDQLKKILDNWNGYYSVFLSYDDETSLIPTDELAVLVALNYGAVELVANNQSFDFPIKDIGEQELTIQNGNDLIYVKAVTPSVFTFQMELSGYGEITFLCVKSIDANIGENIEKIN